MIPYSSGTTGLPKGVMLSHRNLIANVLQFAEVIPAEEDDVLIGVLPFFHIYGQTVIMNAALHYGGDGRDDAALRPRRSSSSCIERARGDHDLRGPADRARAGEASGGR